MVNLEGYFFAFKIFLISNIILVIVNILQSIKDTYFKICLLKWWLKKWDIRISNYYELFTLLSKTFVCQKKRIEYFCHTKTWMLAFLLHDYVRRRVLFPKGYYILIHLNRASYVLKWVRLEELLECSIIETFSCVIS